MSVCVFKTLSTSTVLYKLQCPLPSSKYYEKLQKELTPLLQLQLLLMLLDSILNHFQVLHK